MTYVVPYLYPTSTKSISDTFADHVARGSVNPGTDYKSPYGSRVVAVADGYVSDIVTTNYGSGGRMVGVDHDDGLGTDYLHLSLIAPGIVPGKRVFRGDTLGYSGASGYGDDWWYGPHLHISIRNRHGFHWQNAGNFDFDYFINHQAGVSGGGATPIDPTEDDMPLNDTDVHAIITGLLNYPAFTPGPGEATVTVSQALKEAHQVSNAIFAGGPSMPDAGKSIAKSLAELNDTVTRTDGQPYPPLPADGSPAKLTPRVDNAQTNTIVRLIAKKLGIPTS